MPSPTVNPLLHTVRLRVWDLPTRLFHWALALSAAGLAVTGTLGGDAMNLHFRLGYVVLTLLLFRILWGLIGGYWSRFGSFLYSPATLLAYVRGQRRPEHETGHSPSGALSVFALLTVLAAQVSTGLLSNDEIAFAGPLSHLVSNANVSLATGYHKNVGKWLLLVLVVMHLLAIGYSIWRKRSLVRAMLDGHKVIQSEAPLPASRDDARTRLVALGLLAVCAAATYGIASLAPPAF